MDAKALLIAVVLGAGLMPGTSFADQSAIGYVTAHESDVAICNKVRTALESERNLHLLDVKVSTFKGHVQLTGYVKSNDDLWKAEMVAQRVRGVVQVKNDLLLKGEIRA
jgi:hyperosmotically inducible protein